METKNHQTSKETKTFDSYFKVSALFFIQYQTVGISHLIRKFRIGYFRAERIFNQLAAEGIIEKANGHVMPHKLLIKDEESLNKHLENIDLGEQILNSAYWNTNI